MGKLHSWKEIEPKFSQGLVLGNGASIAFDSRFDYHSLKDKATSLRLITKDVQRVFDHLSTDDFELVLRMLWQASMINLALKIPDKRTTQTYEALRDALIRVVRTIHVSHDEVRPRLQAAASFMSRFSKVLSLSYDVLVYWAILVANEPTPNRFMDCFLAGEFKQDWQKFTNFYGKNYKRTLVFYPHGNLAIASNFAGTEFKIHADAGASLLDTVFEKWQGGYATPVFVSEGTSEQKCAAIHRSPYLSTVYEEVLPNVGEDVVVFGWSFDENDDHLLDAMCCHQVPRRFAVAVDAVAPDRNEFEARIFRKVKKRLGSNKFELIFFDRGSEGCWIAP